MNRQHFRSESKRIVKEKMVQHLVHGEPVLTAFVRGKCDAVLVLDRDEDDEIERLHRLACSLEPVIRLERVRIDMCE